MSGLTRIRVTVGMMLLAGVSLAAEGTFSVGGLSFAVPDGWTKQTPSSSMRKAQLSAPGKDDATAAEVTFFFFGKSGGSIEANKRRWLGQFEKRSDDKDESKTVNGLTILYVSTKGTFMSGPPFGQKVAKPGYGLLGAIVQGSEGNVFVKMTGPAETTDAATAAFKKMVEGSAK